ncbi:MAG: M15 family metallopeptidase [Candidatus Omnitrophica bacterium]|nr:M15 family metallopeptidase [Candidatus Omnitrophota bacterium]
MIARVRIIILTVLCASFIVSTYSTELIDVKEVIPDIILDIRYATHNNFTEKVLYPTADCFLAKEVALALKKVQDDLRTQGYRLKIFDGYRPLSVQREMWKVFPDSRYVANPQKGSVHNKGYAVDLTIVSLDGSPVAMPTDFDEFTERAHTNYKNLPQDVIKHREILKRTMGKYGFTSIKTEWWHFNYKGYKDKPVLDIPFEIIKVKR